MIFKVQITKEKELEAYWVIRAIKKCGCVKSVIAEKEFESCPTNSEIAVVLKETGADFASVVQNYRFYNKQESEEQ